MAEDHLDIAMALERDRLESHEAEVARDCALTGALRGLVRAARGRRSQVDGVADHAFHGLARYVGDGAVCGRGEILDVAAKACID
jgi:hypothetical protein